jgi:DNA modification methylase
MEEKLLRGNNIELLKTLEDNSVDSVVTDPPYGLSFMNKKWDYDVPSVDFWKEVYRVLKPGGHILSFGGTRTYHRMVVNIEDAGFEIRDQIMWVYGSGFPKSHNIGKAVDKLQGNEREIVGKEKQNNFEKYDASMMTKENRDDLTELYKELNITKGTSPYEGWGTALKPANEPICVARKPLSEKSVAENVLKWGTGGINIDGCRVETTDSLIGGGYTGKNNMGTANYALKDGRKTPPTNKLSKEDFIQPEGRFPANIILDEIAGELLDEQSGINSSRFFYQAKVSKKERNMGLDGFEDKIKIQQVVQSEGRKDAGNNESSFLVKNNHPTIKPVTLMAYLCRLITPPNGIVLDPFMGSGSTGIAALLEGFNFIGMEMDEDYFKIAEARINYYQDYRQFLKK